MKVAARLLTKNMNKTTDKRYPLLAHNLIHSEKTEAANEWVFETNGHRWSNNDDSAGDNYGSFLAGVDWLLKRLENKKLRNDLFAK